MSESNSNDFKNNPKLAGLLLYLSERIRGFRAARGMSRKDLARHSAISERYLAQLENGKANPSVEVLWRIAEAMDVDFANLLSQSRKPMLANAALWNLLHGMGPAEQASAHAMLTKQFSARPAGTKQGVALIGLRGAGKTTLGRRAAHTLQLPFVRLGEMIEQLGGMELWEMFSLAGQKTYRRLERQALEHVLQAQPQAVLEAGGSIVSEPATFDLLLGSYFTIWLRASPEEHMQRVAHQGDTRPMQGNHEAMADLNRILREREHDYARADYTLDTRGASVDACAQELTQVIAHHHNNTEATAS